MRQIITKKKIFTQNKTKMLGFKEILIIALVIVLLFGAKKIPELMKGIGKGVKSFKDGMNGIDDDKPKNDDQGNEPK